MPRIVVREPKILAVEPNPTAEPARDEVVVRVHRAGICGSDIHILHGTNPFAVYPRVIGHEFAGEIESIGESVRGISLGDKR